MTLFEARAFSKANFPKAIQPLSFRRVLSGRGTLCLVLLPNGTPLGKGRSWLLALRDAALRFARVSTVEELREKAEKDERPAPT